MVHLEGQKVSDGTLYKIKVDIAAPPPPSDGGGAYTGHVTILLRSVGV